MWLTKFIPFDVLSNNLSAKGRGNIWTKERKFSIFLIEVRNSIILVTPYIKRTKHKTNNIFLLARLQIWGRRRPPPSTLPPLPIFSLMDDGCSFSVMEKFFHENQNKPKYIANFVVLGMIKPYLVKPEKSASIFIQERQESHQWCLINIM